MGAALLIETVPKISIPPLTVVELKTREVRLDLIVRFALNVAPAVAEMVAPVSLGTTLVLIGKLAVV